MKSKKNQLAIALACVTTLGAVALALPGVVNAATGSITVCKVIADSKGNITNGINQPGVTFRLAFFDPPMFDVNTKACTDPVTKISPDKTYPLCPTTSVPGTATFTTPLVLNKKLSDFPAGPGSNGYNAQCKVFSNLAMPYYYQSSGGPITRGGQYFYKQETISGGQWESPLYNDGYSDSISQDNLFPYSTAWFDNDASNNPPLDKRSNEGAIVIAPDKLDGEQALDPANRVLVVFNQEKVVKTPTPKPTPTKTPTPKPSATPTKSPSPTPTKSPTPTPVPSPVPPKKDLGKLEGLPLMLTSLSQVNKGTPYWVKITVNGFGGTATVSEKINGSNFEIINPNYNDPTFGSTFRITKPASGYETEIQDTICPATNIGAGNYTPNCVSAISITDFTAALGVIPNGEKRFVYFKVLPTNTSSGATIDASGSTVTYSNYGTPVNIPLGGPIVIDNTVPFFQIFGGDVWSASPNSNSIVSILTSSSQFFANTLDSIIFHLSGADYGVGEVNPKNWEASQYPKIDGYSYDELHTLYKKYIILQDIKPATLTAGYYEQSPIPGRKMVLTGAGGWGTNAAPLVIDKKVVIFVDGNLYLDNGVNIQVKKDGKSSLTFVVKGRIGIDPSITNIQGIYFADGVIDTACTDKASNNETSACNPDKNDSSVASPLTLEGVFSSNSGFILDRTGTPGNIPGEKFVYRPDMIMAATEILGKERYTWNENNR